MRGVTGLAGAVTAAMAIAAGVASPAWCQADPDGDGVLAGDNCPFVPNPNQADADGDGVGDACDNCPAAPNVADTSLMYAVDGDLGHWASLHLIDRSTGALVRTIGFTWLNLFTLDVHPLTGILYGISRSPASLATIDPVTGAGTEIGGLGHIISDISFAPDGTLYGWSENSDDLVRIDTATGQVTVVGDCGCSTFDVGVAFDAAGTLYMKGGNNWLNVINKTTGTIVTSIPIVGGPTDTMPEFDENNVLYTGRSDAGSFTLKKLDPVTGQLTNVGSNGLGFLSGITFVDGLQPDEDGDGLGDVCDPCLGDPGNDIDEDGFCSHADNCPDHASSDQSDTDGDGVGNVCDNCPGIVTPSRIDTDADGVGDSCDNCRTTANQDQKDADRDRVGDACDNCRLAPNIGAPFLYAVEGAAGQMATLHLLDPGTGAVFRTIGPTGFNNITAIDLNPITGVLYGVTQSPELLIVIDRLTGVGTLVGSTGNYSDISFASDGTLYGMWGSSLQRIDVQTGQSTSIGFCCPGSVVWRPGLAVDSAGVFYMKNNQSFAPVDLSLHVLDPATGQSQYSVPSDLASPALDFLEDDDLVIYTGRWTAGGFTLMQLTAATGTLTTVGSNPLQSLYSLASGERIQTDDEDGDGIGDPCDDCPLDPDNPCLSESDCDDGNPCTLDMCDASAGICDLAGDGCLHAPVADGTNCGTPAGDGCDMCLGAECATLGEYDGGDHDSDGVDDGMFHTLRLTHLPNDGLRLTWQQPPVAPGATITGYRVWRRDRLTCPWQLLGQVSGLSIDILNANDGLNHDYQVTANTSP